LNSTVNSTANAAGSLNGVSSGATGGLNTAGQLTSDSRGVFGLNGLNLNSAASNGTQGSISTSARNRTNNNAESELILRERAARKRKIRAA
jgi:hypothetical protein